MATCFINPGHGGSDPGAVSYKTGLEEAVVATKVAELAAKYLTTAGVYTSVFQYDGLAEICDAANASGADVFVSIHCNSAGNASAQGTETWYYQGSTTSKKLANCIQKQLIASLPVTDRGLKTTTGLYVLKYTDMPACLVELAFISNDYDESLLASEKWRDEMAKAIARGVTDFFQ